LERIIHKGKKFSLILKTTRKKNKKTIEDAIEHSGVAAILAIEDEKVILEKQKRYPNGFVLEIPAGTIEKGEKPIACAFREFKEETGYEAKKMLPLIKFHPSIAFNTEIVHCFIASKIKKVSEQKLEEYEDISIIKMDFKKVLKKIKEGEITDSKTICAIFAYAYKKKIVI
jgi:ADP-ribose pyrophosphatase